MGGQGGRHIHSPAVSEAEGRNMWSMPLSRVLGGGGVIFQLVSRVASRGVVACMENCDSICPLPLRRLPSFLGRLS